MSKKSEKWFREWNKKYHPERLKEKQPKDQQSKKRTKQEQEAYLRMLRERSPEDIAKVRSMIHIPRTLAEKSQQQKPTQSPTRQSTTKPTEEEVIKHSNFLFTERDWSIIEAAKLMLWKMVRAPQVKPSNLDAFRLLTGDNIVLIFTFG